jgi:23S rRNA (uracil1939-C5)-methyltransferase
MELTPDRPVAGGRMLARHEGRVVLVAGAIPGERVRVRVERVSRDVTFAAAVDILDPSPDRREPPGDPACGGADYAHIRYDRQLALKADIIADAFRRIGKTALAGPVRVRPSSEHGHRLRARLHVRQRRAGFFREGTHLLCDAGATGQLLPESMTALDGVLAAIDTRLAECDALVVSENIAATERVIHVEPRDGARLDDLAGRVPLLPGLTGLTTGRHGHATTLAGSGAVTDRAAQLFGTDPPIDPTTAWTRQGTSFFQGNRYLTGALVRQVLESARGERFVDLYAGVGLFAIALAAWGARGLAVEGDRSSAADLAQNAARWPDRLRTLRASVEEAVTMPLDPAPDLVVLDPPRTGVGPEALNGVIAWSAPRVVYVSCDPPTLARDAKRLVAAGYSMTSIDAFDLFPNTAHVETISVFDR